jgi:hypothetical protein
MNSVDTFKKRLREEIASVEQEIQSHNQQVEALTKRLEGQVGAFGNCAGRESGKSKIRQQERPGPSRYAA